MPNTYTQLYIHIVFAVKGRQNLIPKAHKEEIHKYMTGIVQNRKHKMLAVHCMPDHTHIFIGLHPSKSISDLVRDVKTGTSSFIKNQIWGKANFAWQEGYGAFSHSRSQLDSVVKYVNNQESHHTKRTFREEYLDMLEKFGVEYNERFLFEWVDDV